MSNNEFLSERGRSLEDDYFRRRDQELLDKIRRASEADQARPDLGAKTGVTDPEVIQALIDLGYNPENVALLPLVPVVQMAWAEGGVSAAERDLIVKLARSRGIEPGSPADQRLDESLTTRPSDSFFERVNGLIRAVLSADSSVSKALTADDLVKHAEAIAAASGGILGIGKISAEERALLASIAQSVKGRNA